MTQHALQLRPRIQRENITQVEYAIKRLTGALNRKKLYSTPRYRGVSGRGSGRIFFGIQSKREQRSVVKISYSKNTATRSWAAHGEYLQREHAQEEGKKGLGFNGQSQSIDIRETLQEWQKADDPYFFKIIISPDNGHRMDLQQHAREIMAIAERDFGTRLEWVAIDHHNTDHHHVHLLIRGVDEKGQPLVIDPTYIAEGFRQRSQQLATNLLGLRTQKEISLGRERQIDKQRVTDIDRSLRFKTVNNIVAYDTPIPASALGRERRLQEIKRLKFLESLGLAECIAPKRWQLSEQLETTLKALQLSGDIIKSRAQHGYGVLDMKEHLAPSEITAERPITERVIGMGLENELHDRRYLLIEGTDGKVHYIRATNSIVKARDTRQFQNGDIISLTLRTFTLPSKDEGVLELPKNYVAVANYHNIEKLLKAAISCLDVDVIRYVETFACTPQAQTVSSENYFANEYAKAMQVRFSELQQAGLFVQQEGAHVKLVENWQDKLIDIQHGRVVGEFERWRPELNKELPDRPLLGEVVVSDDRKLLLRDIRGSYYQVNNSDLGLKQPIKVGNTYYIRSNRPPGLEFTRTDGRIAGKGYYCPETHRGMLLAQQSEKPDFFLKTKEDVDGFVLAHQRRADTWVKWGIMVLENGVYRPAVDIAGKSLEIAMANKLKELKAKVLAQPGICTAITEKKLTDDNTRFTLLDKLVAEIGKPNEKEQTPIANRLREQATLWQSRGVVLNGEFEKTARQWLSKSSTLAILEKELKTPIQKPIHTDLKRYEGTVVALGAYDEAKVPHVVIKDKYDNYYAFPASEKALAQLSLNQTIEFNYKKPKGKQQSHQKTQKQDTGRSLSRESPEE